MKKLISSVLVVVLVLLSTAVVFAQKSDTIVFIPKSTDVTYWLFLRKGAVDKGKELGYNGHIVASKPQYALWSYKEPVKRKVYSFLFLNSTHLIA